ncbi:MAG TPA: hypothetical protein VI702_04320, partial [Nitrospiria bacterium]
YNSIGFKLGKHRFGESDYFDTNSGLLSRAKMAGLSGELEYERRHRATQSLTLTLGHYHDSVDLKNVCCSDARFSATYLLITPKYFVDLRPFEWYIGGGVGYYYFRREIEFGLGLGGDHLTANVGGLHAVSGIRLPMGPNLAAILEARYAVAMVRNADRFGDSLNVGGVNYAVGLSWVVPGL